MDEALHCQDFSINFHCIFEIFKADFWRRVMKTPIHQPKGGFKTEKFHCYLIKFGVIILKEGNFFFSL